jgi:hypothetical protein
MNNPKKYHFLASGQIHVQLHVLENRSDVRHFLLVGDELKFEYVTVNLGFFQIHTFAKSRGSVGMNASVIRSFSLARIAGSGLFAPISPPRLFVP